MQIAAAVFGISRYEDASINRSAYRLHYAAKDADSFCKYVQAAWAAASDTAIECFTDSTATSTAWSSSITRLSAFDPDIFIVYLSGHAIRAEDSNAQFCLADSSNDGGTLDFLAIDRAFEQIGAETSILLLDCCYAEGVVKQSAFFRSLAGSHARIFLCSARSDQRSCEDSTIQHGLFSNAALRGLAEISPLADGAGYVDIDNLFAFVSEDVSKRAFARKERARQEPVRGGLSTSRLRLPTASVGTLGDHISTYDAVATSFRRWLMRSAALALLLFVISDLSFQHLVVRADGTIAVHSGLPPLDPIRRVLPWGIVDTGFHRSTLNQNDKTSSDTIKALERGRLVANRLWGAAGWPALLAPALATDARHTLSVLLAGRPDQATSEYDPTIHEPPIEPFVALVSLSPQIDRQVAKESVAYRLPNVDLDCSVDVSNYIEFPHLQPGTTQFVKEMDWRMATAVTPETQASNFHSVSRIVAYRHFIFARERAQGVRHTNYDGVQEFGRLADWAQSSWTPTDLPPIPHPSSWCSLTEAFLFALSSEPKIASLGEHTLLRYLKSYDRSKQGDALPEYPSIALSLLLIVGQHRQLGAAIVDGVSAFLRNDDRGLDGTVDFVDWLEAIAPETPFPSATRAFLLESLANLSKKMIFMRS